MKRVYLNFKAFAVVTLAMGLMTACSTDDSADAGGEEPEEEASRWITVAAARMFERDILKLEGGWTYFWFLY